jgi:hypothetical protein
LNNDFKKLLATFELDSNKFTASEWSLVRKVLAGETKKPRRFSD